jgi:hypothetical protein
MHCSFSLRGSVAEWLARTKTIICAGCHANYSASLAQVRIRTIRHSYTHKSRARDKGLGDRHEPREETHFKPTDNRLRGSLIAGLWMLFAGGLVGMGHRGGQGWGGNMMDGDHHGGGYPWTWQHHQMMHGYDDGPLADELRKLKLDQSYIARIIRLASLAPDPIEAILDGQEPDGLPRRSGAKTGLSLLSLRRDLPLEWDEQRRTLPAR